MLAMGAAALACGAARAQTNSPAPAPTAPPPTAGPTNAAPTASAATNVTQLPTTTVTGTLDLKQAQIQTSIGATVYPETKDYIEALPLGENASFNQILLFTPGMAQDSAVNGDLHLRGEHANIQYRINDVLLPEGISEFGLELDPRFVDHMELITGSLPAEYGFRTAGVVDIHTKSGAFEPGGEFSLYGGSYNTIKPSVEFGGSHSNITFFVDGSYDHNDIGIENPTGGWYPIHDTTDQYKTFMYLSDVLDDTSRLSVMGSLSYVTYEVPNTPGLPPGQPSVPTNATPVTWGSAMGVANYPSADLNERQVEQNYYAIVAYQKTAGDLNLQVAAFARESDVHFEPDPIGDLFFNGVASDVDRTLYSGGLELDASYPLWDTHTIRAGTTFLDEGLSDHNTTTVFPVDPNGNPDGAAYPIVQDAVSHAIFAGVYLQDEWKVFPKLTLNYGARFDLFAASFDHENQASPRVNLVYKPTDSTTLHAGYSKYFTPPPLENVPITSVNVFTNTSNASSVTQANGVKAERADYFDLGVSQQVFKGFRSSVDGYYKSAKEQLDDGLFGQSLILQAFNYSLGRVYGLEFTENYTLNNFAAYANIAYSVAQGQNWSSAQFLFNPDDLAYVKNHWIYLDHDQRVTGSFGASYQWKESLGYTRVFADALYGSGLRQDSLNAAGQNVPNGGSVPAYYTVSLGAEQDFRLGEKRHLRARLDVVNLTDNVYELRSGTGVGVNAAQYGMRLGFFGTLSYIF
jgi:outer membrane receptor protein involved in Fe transport